MHVNSHHGRRINANYTFRPVYQVDLFISHFFCASYCSGHTFMDIVNKTAI